MAASATRLSEYLHLGPHMIECSTIDTAHILNSSPVPTFVIDERHVVVHWNDALARMSGIAAKEVVGTHHHWRAFYPAHRPILADLVVDGAPGFLMEKFYRGKYQRSAHCPGGWEAEDFFPSLGEHGRWLNFSAAPLLDDQDNIVGCVETLQDVTERKTLEIERGDQESRLAEIIGNSPVATFVLDAHGRVSHWNRACEALTGFGENDMLGSAEVWRAFYPDDRRSVVLAELVVRGATIEELKTHYGERVVASALVPGAFEARDFFPAFGEQGRTMHFMAAPLHNARGGITGVIETLIDDGVR